jgi:hypothetical protein
MRLQLWDFNLLLVRSSRGKAILQVFLNVDKFGLRFETSNLCDNKKTWAVKHGCWHRHRHRQTPLSELFHSHFPLALQLWLFQFVTSVFAGNPMPIHNLFSKISEQLLISSLGNWKFITWIRTKTSTRWFIQNNVWGIQFGHRFGSGEGNFLPWSLDTKIYVVQHMAPLCTICSVNCRLH